MRVDIIQLISNFDENLDSIRLGAIRQCEVVATSLVQSHQSVKLQFAQQVSNKTTFTRF